MEKAMSVAAMLSVLESQKMEQEIRPAYRPDMDAFEALEAAKVAVRTTSQSIQDLAGAMPRILEFMDLIRDPNISTVPSDVEGKTWGNVESQIRTALCALLSDANSAVRRVVCLGLLRHSFKEGADKKTTEAALNRAIGDQFLLPDKQGSLDFGNNRRFNISDQFGLTTEDRLDFAARIKALFPSPKKSEPKKPQAAPKPKVDPYQKITPGRAWKGEIGEFDLYIPANGNGKGSGTLHMEAQDGGILFIVQTTNGFGDLESQSMPLSALRGDKGEFRENLKIAAPLLSEEARTKWLSKTERLGRILLRGFRAAIEGRHNIDPKEFLSTSVIGDSIVIYEGVFDWRVANEEEAGTFTNLSLRFRRRDDGQICLTEIISEEAKGFSPLEEAVGTYYRPGDRFSRMLPLFCKAFLRATYNQVAGRYEGV